MINSVPLKPGCYCIQKPFLNRITLKQTPEIEKLLLKGKACNKGMAGMVGI